MSIEAEIEVNAELSKDNTFLASTKHISIDPSKVEPVESDIYDYVCAELEVMFGMSFGHDDVKIVNIEDIIEDLKDEES